MLTGKTKPASSYGGFLICLGIGETHYERTMARDFKHKCCSSWESHNVFSLGFMSQDLLREPSVTII